MSKENNYLALAKVAQESEAYEDLHRYCSLILEDDINNFYAWVYKGVAAAFLTDESAGKIKEATACIRKGLDLDGDCEIDREDVALRLKTAYNKFNAQMNDILAGKIKDFGKTSMPSGGSSLTTGLVHNLAQAINANQMAKNQAPARLKGLELVVLICEVGQTEEIYALGNNAFINAAAHSKSLANYFDPNTLVGSSFVKLWDDFKSRAKNKYPNIQLESAVIQSGGGKSEGCFIATAAVGSYDHPKVMILRDFRDQNLRVNPFGRMFIRFYYFISPAIAKKVSNSVFLKKAVMMIVVNPLYVLLSRIK